MRERTISLLSDFLATPMINGKPIPNTNDSSTKLECGPMPNVMAALPNIGAATEERMFRNSLPCATPQSFADAHCSSAVQ